jgi:hypothetical protein
LNVDALWGPYLHGIFGWVEFGSLFRESDPTCFQEFSVLRNSIYR